MANDFVKKLVTYGSVLLVGGLLGVLTLKYVLEPLDEDERPPIIVQNGSIDLLGAIGPNADGWTRNGQTWYFKTTGRKPKKPANRVVHGTCQGTDWKSGDLRIHYTNEAGVAWILTIDVNGANIAVDPNGQPNEATSEQLTIHKDDTVWITSVESKKQNPSGGCTFNRDSNPMIIVE